ncbi:LPS-assembly protein LptD [Thioalkalivibrio sp. XN279]|uniref:LPS-assembly protein LptD n=1 Tax=Thioalkalivibrio sp. XN279 TaxID=2714953 RepID=UPI00140C4D09|nr:LPS assembly protein LptD [Thioalkalivibrio sp. XN279]NHA15044.1 LPS assembly protein LptD [Thioalkalivibrio sp. XN279]
MPRLLAFLAILMGSAPLGAAPVCPVPEPVEFEPLDKSTPIEVSADRAELNTAGDSVFSGGVVVQRGNQRLETEGATWNRAEGRVLAVDGARFTQPGLEVETDRLEYLPGEGTAILTGNRYRLPARPASGGADTIRARGNGRIRMDDVTYTTCPGDDPDWLLSIGELKLDTSDEIGEADNVTLRFFGAPVAYLPYLSFPLSNRRKTGFLVPEFGQSTRNGLEISAPFYFNLAPNYDHLLTPVFLSDRGLKLDNHFRYLRPESRGAIRLDYLHRDSEVPEQSPRVWFNLSHLTRLDNGWRFTAELEDVSDTDYFQNLGESPAVTSRTHVERRLQVDYAGPTWRITARAQNFRTLDLDIPEDERPYARMPQLVADGLWLDGPLGMDLRLRSEAAGFTRGVGPEGARAMLEPEISLPVEAPGFFFTPAARLRMVQYALSGETPGADDAPGYVAPILSVDSGLRFERPLSSGRFVQTLEPRVLYAYIPFRDQEDQPLFDSGRPDFNYVQLFRPNRYLGADRLGDTNQLSFGVTTRLLETGSGREFLTAAIGKAWYFEDPRVTLPGESLQTAGSSPIVLELGLGLFNNWNADIGYQWDNVSDTTRLAQFRLQYQPAPNRVVNLAYRYRPDLLEDIAFSMGWPLSDRWSFVTALEYSLRDKTTVDQVLGVQYESCCWAIRFAATEQVSRRDGSTDNAIRLQVEFKGLGGQSARRRYESDILGYSAYDQP